MLATQDNTVTVTDRAVQQIAQILSKEPSKKALRVSVSGGGCSGFQYEFDLDAMPGDDDTVIEREGVMVLIDSMSLMYMSGSEIDYVDDLIGASFQIRNPHATASCGCGTSFTV